MQQHVIIRTLTPVINQLRFLLCAVMISSSPVLAQDNSLNAPEVLDLDDPFARGINRAADQASGSL